MKLGAMFLPVRFPEFLESVKCAEESGYARVWIADSHLIWEDTYVYMTRALESTREVVIGTAVTNPVTRHYTVTASAHATLSRMYPGRVILGIGRGESSVKTLGVRAMKTATFDPLVRQLKPLMAGEKREHRGQEIYLSWAEEEVPLMMAATGPKNLRLAGAVADIVQLQVGSMPSAVEWAISQVRAGAEAAGRDPAAVEICVHCAMWVSDDMAEGRAKCRWAAGTAANHLANVDRFNPDHGMPDDLMEIIKFRNEHYNYYEHTVGDAKQLDYLTDEMIDQFAIIGDASTCLERIGELSRLGTGEIAVGLLNGDLRQMETVGAEIIGPLRGLAGG